MQNKLFFHPWRFPDEALGKIKDLYRITVDPFQVPGPADGVDSQRLPGSFSPIQILVGVKTDNQVASGPE